MGKKKITSMRLNEDLIKKAHALGLNVTKVCENAIKEAVKRLEGNNPKTRSIRERYRNLRFIGAGG